MKHVNRIKSFFSNLSRKQLIFVAVGILVVGGTSYALVGGGTTEKTVLAERGEVREEVVVTGKTVSSSSVRLGFEVSGKVVEDNVDVGTKVSVGQTLVVLDQSELLANLNKAKANLNKALVELSVTRRESVSSHDQAVLGLKESIDESYIRADDAVRNQADQLFTNPTDFNATFNPSFVDGGFTYLSSIPSAVKSDLSNQRVELEKMLREWKSNISNVGSSSAEIENAYTLSRRNLQTVQDFLDNIAAAVNSASTDQFDYRATVSAYKTSISTARTSVINAIASLSSAKSTYNNAPQLDSSTSGNYDNVLAEEARIESLRQDVAAFQADLSKTVLTSPIAGVVTQADAKRGEMIRSGDILVSVVSTDKLRVEANISEVSIGRVETGNPVTLTFDAFPQENYEGTVSYTDPGEILIDEVPTYKVTVVFNSEIPERVRSGLTANLRILTDRRADVVKLPAFAVKKDGMTNFVTIKTAKDPEKRVVELGLRGEDGTVEVKSGLEAGEEVIVD